MKFIDYSKLDQKICQIAGAVETNLISFITPQNLEEEKKKFMLAVSKKETYNPHFNYIPRNPLYSYFKITPTYSTYKQELNELLEEIKEDETNDVLSLIFEKKIIDLFDRMELVRSVGTENFVGNTESYYGGIPSSVFSLAKETLSKNHQPEKGTISFGEAKEIIDAFTKRKKIRYKVVEKNSAGSRFSVNLRTKEIQIKKDYLFSKDAIQRLIAHEIEGHIYRYENGLLQPYKIFSRGLSKETLETEEGLAVYVEQQQGINIAPQLREYAGRVMAINTALKHSFWETYEEMRKHFDEEDAFNLTLRAKRGTWKQEGGGAFTKDALYLKGMLAVQDYIKERPISELYFGRYAIYDAPLVLGVAGLKKPKYLPEFLKK